MKTLEFSITTLEQLQMVAVHTLYQGSDYYGETVLDFGGLHYVSQGDHWVQNLVLRQSDGHPCTSGIGIYIKGDSIEFFSSKWVFKTRLTYEMEKILNGVRDDR